MWTYSLHNTISGQRLTTLSASSSRWGRTPGAGDGEHVFQLLDADVPLPRSIARQLAMPNEVALVAAWDGVPLYAGLVLVGEYSRDGGTVTVQHADIRVLFSERLTFGVGAYGQGDLVLTGKSLSGLVRGILQRGVYEWGTTWRIPLDLPADGAGGESLSVKNWEWSTIGELLERVEKLGAIIDFDPYYDGSGNLRWATRVGVSALPGASLEFVVTADETPITGLKTRLDGTQQLSGCFYMGKGTEADMRFGEAGFISGPTIPVRDAARSAKDESDPAKLNRMALTDLQHNRNPANSWTFALVADGTWNPQLLKPGARIRLHHVGDPYLLDGYTDLIVTGVTGNDTHTLIPEVTLA